MSTVELSIESIEKEKLDVIDRLFPPNMREAAEIIYPDRWEIQFDIKNFKITRGYNSKQPLSDYLDFVIHFPEITIKNSGEKTHVIKDLFVALEYYDGEETYAINGKRTTVSRNEIYKKYAHSHLPRHHTLSDYTSYDGFCLGDSELLTQLTLFETFNTVEDYLYFFTLLNAYLEWESLEGTPYISINTLNRYSVLGKDYYNEDSFSNIPKKIIHQILSLNGDLTIEVTQNEIFVKPDSKLIKTIVAAYENDQEMFNEYTDSCIAICDQHGNMYSNGVAVITEEQERNFLETQFEFRNKQINYKIYEDSNSKTIFTKISSPGFTKAIAKRFSEIFTDIYFGNSEFGEKNRSKYPNRLSEKDNVFM